MKLTLERFHDDGDRTLGLLLMDGVFQCLTLEDERRTIKVYGETRIPAGIYAIKLRTEGGFHNRYRDRFGDWHRGMPELQDVPGFEYILIHIGNTDEHTAGCLLVGMGLNRDQSMITASERAYRKIYPAIADALEAGEAVSIEIIDQDRMSA